MASKNIRRVCGWFLWDMHETHVYLMHFPSAFTMIAGRTCSHYIRPDMWPAHVAWDDMIHGQAALVPTAILTGIIVTAEDFATS